MSRWGSVIRIAAAYVISAYTQNWALFASQVESERQRRKRDKANTRARAAYNEAQKDRLEMLDLQPDAPRSLVLGRVRYVEGVRRRWSSGTNSEKLTMIVSFAGHEIDAFESWYLDDAPVTRDGSGWVQESPWKQTANEPASNTGTADGSGAVVITLSYTPVASSWSAVWSTGSGDTFQSGAASVSVAGTTATVTGAAANSSVAVNYLRSVGTTHVRIYQYLGADSQNIGDLLDTVYPGNITATDRFAGIAAAALELNYSPDVFPQGPPNLTAVMRGAKCYDPRLDSTVAGGSGSHRIATPSTWAWTENPALCALRYALWGSGLALSYGRGITARTLADVIAAANQCDISTSFTLRMPDTSTSSVTLPRHRCGITIAADADPRTAMDSIVDTMAGEWAFDGPELRLRAGVKAASVASIDQTWLVEAYSAADEDADEPVLTAAQAISREQRWNHVGGRCVDPSERYQMLPYPAVRDATLATAKGEKRGELDLPGVNHVAHAQHLASMEIRRRQAGTTQVVQCDPRAEMLQLFDIVTETIPDYGISAKPFEVVGVEIAFGDAPVRVMLREIADSLFTVDAELSGRDPAPDSNLRAPWDVGTLGALTVTSGTSALQDNSIVARALVTWPAVTGEWIRAGGKIEIQYTRADQALPAGDWASWVEEGNSTAATIPGLLTGRPYIFRGRLVQPMPLVRGPWSAVTHHTMSWAIAALSAVGGGNLLRNSSFEVDADADGVADNWAAFTGGTTGTVTHSGSTSITAFGGRGQRVDATNLSTGTSDRVGYTQLAVSVVGAAGKQAVLSGFAFAAPALTKFALYVVWLDSSNAVIGSGVQTDFDATGTLSRYATAPMAIPTNAAKVDVSAWFHSRPTSAGAFTGVLDAMQIEIGGATAYAPRADELLAGSVGTTQLAASAATTVVSAESTSGTKTRTRVAGAFVYRRITLCEASWTNDTGAAQTVEVSAHASAKYAVIVGSGNARIGAGYSATTLDNSVVVDGDVYAALVPLVTSDYADKDYSISVSVAAGASIFVAPYVSIVPTATGDQVDVFYLEAAARITVIKR